MKKLIGIFALAAGLLAYSAQGLALCPGCTDVEMKTYVCKSTGWVLRITVIDNKKTSVSFSTTNPVHTTRQRLPGSAPQASLSVQQLNQPLFVKKVAPSSYADGLICLAGGTGGGGYVPAGEEYYETTFPKSHAPNVPDTSLNFGSVGPLLFESPAAALNHYRTALANAGATGIASVGCSDLSCSRAGSSPRIENTQPPVRFSITEFLSNNPAVSTNDILIAMGRGGGWKMSRSQFNKFKATFPAYANVLHSSGRLTVAQSNFIFRKLPHGFTPALQIMEEEALSLVRKQSAFETVLMTLGFSDTAAVELNYIASLHYSPDNVPPELVEVVFPPVKYLHLGSSALPWPSGTRFERLRLGMHGKKPRGWCPALDDENEYIPPLVHNSAALLELTTDVAYLTSQQLDRLRDEKGLDLWPAANEYADQVYGAFAPEDVVGLLPISAEEDPRKTLARKELHCSKGQATKHADAIVRCTFKDEAYYDRLIDELILVNPVLDGNINNHPCIARGKRATQLAIKDAARVNPPKAAKPTGALEKAIIQKPR